MDFEYYKYFFFRRLILVFNINQNFWEEGMLSAIYNTPNILLLLTKSWIKDETLCSWIFRYLLSLIFLLTYGRFIYFLVKLKYVSYFQVLLGRIFYFLNRLYRKLRWISLLIIVDFSFNKCSWAVRRVHRQGSFVFSFLFGLRPFLKIELYHSECVYSWKKSTRYGKSREREREVVFLRKPQMSWKIVSEGKILKRIVDSCNEKTTLTRWCTVELSSRPTYIISAMSDAVSRWTGWEKTVTVRRHRFLIGVIELREVRVK